MAFSRGERIPLTGADCFLRAFDYEARRYHGGSHLAQLVLRLGPGFDQARFEARLHQLMRDHPVLRAAIRRPACVRAPAYHVPSAAAAGLPLRVVDAAAATHTGADPMGGRDAVEPLRVAGPMGGRDAVEGSLGGRDAVKPLRVAGPMGGRDAVEPLRVADPMGGRDAVEPLRDCEHRPIPAVFFDRLNDRFAITRGDLLRFDIVRYGDAGTDLAMTWAHMLFDANGSEQFIARLASDGAREPASGNGAAATVVEPFSWRRLARQGQVARRWGERMMALGDPPSRSLAGPLRAIPMRVRYALTTLNEADTRAVVDRSARHAGFLTPTMFHLAAAVRAHAAVFARRNAEPESYLIPLPVRVPAAATGEVVIGTHVSLLWFHVHAQHTRALGTLVEELKRQRREQIRAHAIEETATALAFVRLLPLRVYAYMLRRSLRGELASFVFAFTGEILPGVERVAGAEILNAFHAPTVQPSPGSGLIMSIRRGRLNIAHVYQDGVMTDAERELLVAHLRDDLLRTPP